MNYPRLMLTELDATLIRIENRRKEQRRLIALSRILIRRSRAILQRPEKPYGN